MSFTRFRERSRDVQDGIERHVWGEIEYTKHGPIMKGARGTDTQDEEMPIPSSGVGFNLKKNANSEVFALASSSDTMLKMVTPTIPRDKQRRWEEENGGVQHPTDPEFALNFSSKLAHITKNKFGVGEKGEFEVKGEEGYFRVKKLIVDGELVVNKQIKTPQVVQGKEDPPKFEGSKQAAIKDDQQGGGGGQPAQAAAPLSRQLDLFEPQLELRFR